MSDWFAIACERSTVVRSLKFAVVVGVILIAINHGDAILVGEIDRARVFQMLLTVVVPYMVSTFSSVGARREMARHTPEATRRVE